MTEEKTLRPLSEIAKEIREDWKNPSFDALLDIDAMASLNSIDDEYSWYSGRDVVYIFLQNSRGWRGDTARRIKAELKEMLSK